MTTFKNLLIFVLCVGISLVLFWLLDPHLEALSQLVKLSIYVLVGMIAFAPISIIAIRSKTKQRQ